MFWRVTVCFNKGLHKIVKQVFMIVEVYAYCAHLNANIVAASLVLKVKTYLHGPICIKSRLHSLSLRLDKHHLDASSACVQLKGILI